MPHDRSGKTLVVGDKVLIPATVTAIQPGEDYCNCSVELDYLMPPDNTKSAFSAINCRQVSKADGTLPPPGDTNPPPHK